MKLRFHAMGAYVVFIAVLSATGSSGASASTSADPAAMTSNSGKALAPAPTASRATGAGTSGYEGRLGRSAEPLAVFPPDNRVRVTNTTVYPHRAIGFITSTTASCTGALVGRDTVITAGHCLHTGAGGAFRTGIKFFPGRNGGSSPYGSCVPRPGGLYVQNGWSRSSDERYDNGIIKLSCTKGDTVGYFGFFWQSASFNGVQVALRGYKDNGQMWTQNAPINVTQTYNLFYKHDTEGSQGGSPLFHNRASGSPSCVGECILGFNTHGPHGSSAPHSTHNHGGRITKAIYDNIVAVRSQA